jgi:septal ring factor EnvC (AmiA/AmiB activator)
MKLTDIFEGLSPELQAQIGVVRKQASTLNKTQKRIDAKKAPITKEMIAKNEQERKQRNADTQAENERRKALSASDRAAEDKARREYAGTPNDRMGSVKKRN